jgi:hypothetical protein
VATRSAIMRPPGAPGRARVRPSATPAHSQSPQPAECTERLSAEQERADERERNPPGGGAFSTGEGGQFSTGGASPRVCAGGPLFNRQKWPAFQPALTALASPSVFGGFARVRLLSWFGEESGRSVREPATTGHFGRLRSKCSPARRLETGGRAQLLRPYAISNTRIPQDEIGAVDFGDRATGKAGVERRHAVEGRWRGTMRRPRRPGDLRYTQRIGNLVSHPLPPVHSQISFAPSGKLDGVTRQAIRSRPPRTTTMQRPIGSVPLNISHFSPARIGARRERLFRPAPNARRPRFSRP